MSGAVYRTEPLLRGQFVFLSASKPSRNLDRFPLASRRVERTSIEIEEAVVSLARAVFSHEGRLVFGGHPSISPLVASVAAEYYPARHIPPGQEPVWIYQSKAFRKVIPRSTENLEELGFARIHWIDEYNGEEYRAELAGQEQCLESLRLMREALVDLKPGKGQPGTDSASNPVAMVAIGGMEGVLREARLFLEKTPGQVYVLRTTGGASLRLVSYLQNNMLQERTILNVHRWENRISTLEEILPTAPSSFGAEAVSGTHAGLPLAPYAVLMQSMVRRIAGKESPAQSR